MCGDVCLVDDFVTKQNLRCGDFVEGQYFTYAKGTNDWPCDMCCFCCNVDDVLSQDEMKNEYDTGGRQPLLLCRFCVSLKVRPPVTNASTNFVEKMQQKSHKKEEKS